MIPNVPCIQVMHFFSFTAFTTNTTTGYTTGLWDYMWVNVKSKWFFLTSCCIENIQISCTAYVLGQSRIDFLSVSHWMEQSCLPCSYQHTSPSLHMLHQNNLIADNDWSTHPPLQKVVFRPPKSEREWKKHLCTTDTIHVPSPHLSQELPDDHQGALYRFSCMLSYT